MACKYCTPSTGNENFKECSSFPIFDIDYCYTDSAHIEYFDSDDADTVLNLMRINYGNPYSRIDVRINYCPFCGEKLREQKDDFAYNKAKEMPQLIGEFTKRDDGKHRTDFQQSLHEIEEAVAHLEETTSRINEQYKEHLKRCGLW